jgi:sugar lactone lactonase YvrE
MSRRLTTIATALLCVAGFAVTAPLACAQAKFQVEIRWSVPGGGSWDYLTVDSATHRLYIAHQTKVDVVDVSSGTVVGAIQGLTRCHGIVLSPDGRTGFISDGGANKIVVFDPASLATVGEIPAGTNPDGMVYERSTNTLWAFNGASKNVTVIDAVQRKSVGTIALPGKPEFPATDNQGTIFVNIEDKNAIVRLNAKSMSVTATWPLAGCESPSGLAFDVAGGRLFSVCDGKKMAVTDAHSGKSLATPSIGDGPDATAYDERNKLAFSSNGDGTLSVVDTNKAGYPVVQTLPTIKGARTMALDSATGKIYTVSARSGPTPAPTAAVPHPRPTALPDSFTVLVIGRK